MFTIRQHGTGICSSNGPSLQKLRPVRLFLVSQSRFGSHGLMKAFKRINASTVMSYSLSQKPRFRARSSALARQSVYNSYDHQAFSERLVLSRHTFYRVNHSSSTLPVERYEPPQTGLLSILPRSWVPYAELVRLDKPTGTYYLFFPCLFSTLLAAPMAIPMAGPVQVGVTTGLFFAGALIMRGAGCAINDLWDRNLDPHVARTKYRPIARGALSPQNAILFTGTKLLAGLGILLQFPTGCLWYGIPSLLLVTTYPLAKRVTDYPQFVLGLTFSWGAMMGFPALGIDLINHSETLMAAAALYSSCVAWTVLYDMIYAHMDIKDDVSAGIRSIALRYEHNTKAVLSTFAVIQVTLLALAGIAAGSGPIFFLGSCGGAAVSLGVMIWRVRLKEVKNCWWWFKNGCWFTGGSIAIGLMGDYLMQWYSAATVRKNIAETTLCWQNDGGSSDR